MASLMHRRRAIALAVGCVGVLGFLWIRADAREQGKVVEITLDGDHYAFAPARIEVQKDDLVKVTFHAKDIAHSFTVDAYRIAKRVEPGKPIHFEFRADTTGTFRFYCSLTSADGRPHDEHGELVVRR